MKLNQFTLLTSVVCLGILSACNGNKPYTITGTLDLPAQIPYGDTVIDMPSFEGTWVYLLDFNSQLLDSAQIVDNTFKFTGEVDSDDTYFVQLVSQIGSTLLVVEPGDIEVYMNPDIVVSGTPSNDAMSDIDAALENLNSDTYEYLSQLTDSLRTTGEEVPEETQMKIFEEFRQTMINILDSAYNANKGNQAAAYAVIMRHMDVQSADEFEKAMEAYPKSIQENELVQVNLRTMRQYEMMDTSAVQQIDPSIFGIEETDAVVEE
jgi:hypothetical protein